MRTGKPLIFVVSLSAVLLSSSCSVNVKKENDGQDKQVDISSPLGGIHVSKGAHIEDTGLPVYPGARLKPKDTSGDDKSANVNISGFGYGLKVVALEYVSDDAPAKVISFYKDQLKHYGEVLVCRTDHLDIDMDVKEDNNHSSHALTCQGSSGNNTELKVGTKENQHIVAVESQGKGSDFSLVYIRTHGKDADI